MKFLYTGVSNEKYLLLSTTLLLIVSCSPSITTIKEIDDHFLYDLGSENNRIAAELQETVFENGLDTLSYDYYISFLDKNSTPSAEGLVRLIKKQMRNILKLMNTHFL